MRREEKGNVKEGKELGKKLEGKTIQGLARYGKRLRKVSGRNAR